MLKTHLSSEWENLALGRAGNNWHRHFFPFLAYRSCVHSLLTLLGLKVLFTTTEPSTLKPLLYFLHQKVHEGEGDVNSIIRGCKWCSAWTSNIYTYLLCPCRLVHIGSTFPTVCATSTWTRKHIRTTMHLWCLQLSVCTSTVKYNWGFRNWTRWHVLSIFLSIPYTSCCTHTQQTALSTDIQIKHIAIIMRSNFPGSLVELCNVETINTLQNVVSNKSLIVHVCWWSNSYPQPLVAPCLLYNIMLPALLIIEHAKLANSTLISYCFNTRLSIFAWHICRLQGKQ